MKLAQTTAGVSLYGALLILALAAGWLLPNHYPPWNTFHGNAWIAGVLVIIAFRVLATHSAPVQISVTSVFLAAVSATPWIQYGAGILPLPSNALVACLYLLGFAAAFALGEHWGRQKPGQPVTLVLTAACIAAVISTGLQLFQWLGLTQYLLLQDAWVLHLGEDRRPYANLGQPNQLASLLLWGVLGVGWAWHKRWIGLTGACVLATFILFGVALTESRTALLTLTLGFVTLSIKKMKFLDRRTVRTAQCLYLYYLVCLTSQAPLGRLLGLDTQLTMLTRTGGELRFSLWRMALDATTVNPWFGFGWGRANAGFFQVFLNYPQFADLYFEQSHNMLLDLVLWIGWPLGVGVIVCSLLWLHRVVFSIASADQMLTVAALGVMLIHAMLEFPLHYGYFLWPFGLLAGSAAAGTIPTKMVFTLPRKAAAVALAALLGILAVVVHDYLKIEASFTEFRFQIMHIGRGHNEAPPETWLLIDWPKVIALGRATPHAGMTELEIAHWEALLIYNTSPLAFRKVIGALMLNGHPEEAKLWADRSCWLLQKTACKTLIDEWQVPMRLPDKSALSAPR